MDSWKVRSSLNTCSNELSSRGSTNDGLDCPICWERFDYEENLPHVLWCGHTLCKSCVMGLPWAVVKLPVVPVHMPFFIACPWCQFLSCRVVWKGKLKSPSKNFALLWMLENEKGKGSPKLCTEDAESEGKITTSNEIPNTNNTLLLPGNFHPNYANNSHRRGNGAQTHGLQYVRSFMWNTRFIATRGRVSFFLCQRLGNLMGLVVHMALKLTLVLMLLIMLLYVLPLSTMVLAIYLLATIVIAFPSFLVVSLALPSLGWLVREIAT